MSHAEGSCCADAVSFEIGETRQSELEDAKVEHASFWEQNIDFVPIWLLRLLQFAVMLIMKTSWLVREMLWSVFG